MINLFLDYLVCFGFKFEINLFSLFSFLGGILTGFLLFGLIYLISCLISLKRKETKINKEIKNLSQSELEKIIDVYQEAFYLKKKELKKVPFDYFKSSIYQMMIEIATKFYPKSTRPLSELTLNELILLDKYIIEKIDSLLSKKGLSLFRNLRLSLVISIIEKKNYVENTKIVQGAKKYKIKKKFNAVMNVVNVINPVHWVKKIVVNPTMNMLINKLFILCYSIVAEEVYAIYSKQAIVEQEQRLKDIVQKLEYLESNQYKDEE